MALKFQKSEDEQLFDEAAETSPVRANIRCSAFVSRSKGLRKGKRRIRRAAKEIILVKYYSRTHTLNRAPLDEWAQEIYEGMTETITDLDADYLLEQIKTEFGL